MWHVHGIFSFPTKIGGISDLFLAHSRVYSLNFRYFFHFARQKGCRIRPRTFWIVEVTKDIYILGENLLLASLNDILLK